MLSYSALCLCWFSFACSCFLTFTYWRLGYRFRLLAWLSFSLALQHSQKLYLMTLKYFGSPADYSPNPIGSFLILVNAFFVATYNMSIICICVHVYLLLQFAGTAYDHILAQLQMIGITAVGGLVQTMYVLFRVPSVIYIDRLPFLWVQHAILTAQVIICPILVVHLLVKCLRARIRTFELLQKSSISKSLMWRLLFALFSVAILTSKSLYIQVTSSPSVGSSGNFADFFMYKATMAQLANRYQVGNIVGPVIAVIFLTAQEPSTYINGKWTELSDWFKRKLCSAKVKRKDSVGWIGEDEGFDFVGDFSATEARYSIDTQKTVGCCPNDSIAQTASSLDPKDSRHSPSVDLTLNCSQHRRLSDSQQKLNPMADLEPGATRKPRSSSVANVPKLSGSEPSVSEYVVIEVNEQVNSST